MAIGRVYTVSFDNVAVTAVQDLFGLYVGTAPGSILLHEVRLGQISATTVGNLRVSIRRLPATVSSGSGGSAGTVQPRIFGDAAATMTARINDTTPATTGGTVQTMIADVFNVVNGWLYLPAPDDRILAQRTQAIIVSLLTAPLSSETMSGTAVVEEIF